MQEGSPLERTDISRTYEAAELVLQAHAPKMMCMYVSLNTQSKFAALSVVWYSFLDTQESSCQVNNHSQVMSSVKGKFHILG